VRPRRRPHRRWLAGGVLVLVLAIPARVVVEGLVDDRDLAAAWRAFRAPGPVPVTEPTPLRAAPFGAARVVGSLRDPELVEVSGLAGSRRGASLLWAVNDGGNPLRLYAIATDGERLAAFDLDVEDPGDTDWEDLASFRWRDTAYLLVADVGDNRSWRRSVRLWLVEEPVVAVADAASGTSPGRVVPIRGGNLAFSDGPRDCEAVAVDETTGTLLLISKRTAPPVLYAADLTAWLDGVGAPGVAQPLGPVAIPPPSPGEADSWLPSWLHMPTALDLAPDGTAAFVLSYAAGWHFLRAPGESWAEALARSPTRLPLPALALAEAAAFQGESLYVTSEVDRLGLFRWPAPLVRFDPAPGAPPSTSATSRY